MAARAEDFLHCAWAPQPGPQSLLLTCPVEEIFYGGSRGGGKTDGVLGLWSKHAALYGKAARGVLFRRSYPELEEVEQRAREIFGPLGAYFHQSKHNWFFPNGAWLRIRSMDKDRDVSKYIGPSFSMIICDELTHWPTADPIDKLRGSLRSPAGVPCQFIATGNPGAAGHSWVRERYIDAAPPGQPFQAEVDGGEKVWRVYIPSRIEDNPRLLDNDPKYLNRIRAAGPPWLVRAWLKGDWNVAPGAFFEGLWNPDRHVLKRPFPIPLDWPRWRALDWGFRAPYSVGWYTMDPDGVMHRYRELYGWGGKANVGTRQDASVVAQLINDIEAPEKKQGVAFHNSPADTQIWQTSGTGIVVADRFVSNGVIWTEAEKGPGSRVHGLQELAARLHEDAIYVWPGCKHWLRTVPVITPDDNHPEDVDTKAEDHTLDETRYSLQSRRLLPARPPKRKPLPAPSPPINGEAHRPVNVRRYGSTIDQIMGRT